MSRPRATRRARARSHPQIAAAACRGRTGNNHFAKYVSYFCETTKGVAVRLVDSLPVQGKCSHAAARAVARAFIALDTMISGSTSDSGGGAVLDSMAENMDGLGVCERRRGPFVCDTHRGRPRNTLTNSMYN